MEFNEQQLEAINTIDGNISVIATAGSGKTAVLTERISNLVNNHGVNTGSILATTFSNKAKDHMDTKLREKIKSFNPVKVSTFHSFANEIIKYSNDGNSKYNLWKPRWEKDKVLSQASYGLKIDVMDDYKLLTRVYDFISLQKRNMLYPEDELIFTPQCPFSNDIMYKLYKAYEDHKNKYSLIDFDDYLNYGIKVLETNDRVFKYFNSKYKYILADEYQDTSRNQARLIELLGKNNNVFVVGDFLQSIYGFQGGDSSYLIDFESKWSNSKVINMNTNYRCSKEIVKTANYFAKSIADTKNKNYLEPIANNPKNKTPQYKQ
jgi:DNA helicase-2/ATP-dependent DNA helicase PcrA